MKKFISFCLTVIMITSTFSVSASDNYFDNNTEIIDHFSETTSFLQSDVYKFDGPFVIGVKVKTTVGSLKNNFDNNNLEVTGKLNSVFVCTGNKITNGTDTCTICVTGDINGDGNVTVTDLTALSEILVDSSQYKIGSAGYSAGDVDLDNNVNSIDLYLLNKIILEDKK